MLPWKMMFFFILLSGSFIAMSASSWFMAWMGLEINMLALLAILMASKSTRNSEASLKYFLVQALASAILISSAFSSSAIFSFLSSLSFFSNFIILSLLVKLGGAPFHGWLPQVVEGFTWNNNSIILTWQKIAPFILIVPCLEMKFSSFILNCSIILSVLLGAILGLNQMSIRKILTFSSINHIGWMLTSIAFDTLVWLMYFLIYSIMLLSLINFIKNYNISLVSSTSFNTKLKAQLVFFMSLLSFGGLPPFLGFAAKWVVISSLISQNFTLLLILVMSSLLTLYFYTRMAFSSFLLKQPSNTKFNLMNSKNSLPLMVNVLGMIITPIIFLVAL